MTARRRALIVDDSPETRRGLAGVLRAIRWGVPFETETAESGEIALACARATASRGEHYAVAFVDMQMPGLDGHETAEALWEIDPDLSIVFFTGKPRLNMDRYAGREARIPLIVKKPIAAIEVQQIALAMAASRALVEEERAHERTLANQLDARTEQAGRARAALVEERAQGVEVERRLALAERLRFAGELALSLAVEINNPLQYTLDAVTLMRELHDELEPVRARLATAATRDDAWAEAVREDAEARDLGFALEDLPGSLAQCADGLRRVADLVGALKQLSSPDLDERAPTDLREVVEAVLTLTRSQYKYVADVEVDLGGVPLVLADAPALQQVLINLIVNACHAMEDRAAHGAARGTLRLSVFEAGGGAAVSIEDTGGGIPDDVRDRMFEPFFTTKDVGRGTGQGLSIARSIVVEGHGGALDCETVAGVGTTFTVTLPARGAEGERAA